MVSEDIDFVAEIARVMKPNGVCLATCFVLDAVSRENVAAGLTSPKFAYEFESRPVVLTICMFPKQQSHTTRDFCWTSMISTVSSLRELCMVNGVEKDSCRIGKMKFGLASSADLALGTAIFGALT